MKPVYLVTLEYPPQIGGVASYYGELVKHLPIGSVTVITNDRNQLLHPWWKTWFVLRQHFKKNGRRPILVGQVLPLGTVVWLFSKLYRVPYIVFVHGMDVTFPQTSVRKRWLLKRILGSAKFIIANSQFTARLIKNNRVEVITPGPLITPHLTAEPVADLPVKFVLSVGRLVERKGFDQVIASVEKFPDLQYVIAGQGSDQARLQQLITEKHLTDRVQIMSGLNNGQIATLYSQCEFLAMPARQLPNGDVEGFGIVVLEANLFGKPAIGGRTGGMTESIQDQVTGLVVDPTDSAALVHAMTKLVSDQMYCKQLGEQAKHWAEQQLWTDKAMQLSQLLEDL